MKSKKNRSAKVITASVLGASILASIFALPGAEASVKDGRFFVKAAGSSGHWSIANFPKAKPGQGGDSTPAPSTSPTGEPSNLATSAPPTAPPTTAPPVANAVAEFACGPLQYTVTQDMLDQAARNRQYFALNQSSPSIRPTSDGWSELYGYEPGGSNTDYTRGLRSPVPVDYTTEFSSSLKQRTLTDLNYGADTNTILRFSSLAATATRESSCNIRDLRGPATANKSFYYSWLADKSFEEGRYESDGSNTYATIVTGDAKIASGAKYQRVNRAPASSAYIGLNSSSRYILPSRTVLSSFTNYEDGRKFGNLYLPTDTDGYNKLVLNYEAGGIRTVSYKLFIASGNGSVETSAKRTTGPSKVTYDSSGKITELQYYNRGDGKFYTLSGTSATVANYNTVTKQSWDGSYAKVESYDFTVPFQPTRPN